MTRLVYENAPVIFETNGDCSAITINFVDEKDQELVRKLRNRLQSAGFNVEQKFVNNQQVKIYSPDVNVKYEPLTVVLGANDPAWRET